ncbi:MAG: hypothetical protein RL236_927 [Pseudomonadota bacterium]
MNLIYCSNLISEKENVGLTNADRMFTIRSCSTLLFPALLHFYTFTLLHFYTFTLLHFLEVTNG